MRKLATILITLIFELPIFADGSILNNATGFIENKGQIIDQNKIPNKDVLYLFNSNGMNIQLRRGGFSYDVYANEEKEDKDSLNLSRELKTLEDLKRINKTTTRYFHRIDIDLAGANINHGVVAEERSEAYFNYYNIEKPVLNVHKYNRVTYTDIYPGIDLVFTAGNGKPFEYTFVVKSGASIADIRLHVSGANSLKVNDDVVSYATTLSTINETIPRCWYVDDSKEYPIDFMFKQDGHNTFGFESNDRIPKNVLVYIDPFPSRVWGTYYGGESEDLTATNSLNIDSNQDLILGGVIASCNNITTVGAYVSTCSIAPTTEGCISKFSKDGKQIWGTYVYCWLSQCFIDHSDKIIMIGFASGPNNPMVTPGAHQPNIHGETDPFIAKFTTGGFLIWGTYYGGNEQYLSQNTSLETFAEGVVDEANNIYVCGTSISPDFIATPGSFQPSYAGGEGDGMIVKFSSDGQRIWGTYYGGSNMDRGYCCTLTKEGQLYILGNTKSASNIATLGSFNPTLNSSGEAGFVACFNTDGIRSWCTYLGYSLNLCKADTGNCVFICGRGNPTNNIGTPGTFLSVPPHNQFNFITKFDPSGARIMGTFFNTSSISGLFVDSINSVYIVGLSNVQDTLTVTPGAFQGIKRGSYDGFLTKFTNEGQREWGTYYGGLGNDQIVNCAVSQDGFIYLAGITNSTEQIVTSKCFQTSRSNPIATPGSHQSTYGGSYNDFFIAKFALCQSPDTSSGIIGPNKVCTNASGIVFSTDPIIGATSVSWCVSSGLTIVSGQGTNSITVNAGSSIGTDTVSIYGSNSCGDGFAVIKLITITGAIPELTGPDSVCVLNEYSYHGATGMTNYQWILSPGGSIVSGGSSSDDNCVIRWNTTGNQTVKLYYDPPSLCPLVDTARIEVSVHESLPVSITIVQQGTICEGNEAIFIATPVNGGNKPILDWFVNGNNVFSGNTNFSYSPIQGDVITCRLTSNITTCLANNPAFSNSLLVNVNPSPQQIPIRHD
jgi:hypothetical protein